jgi:hypothetical protein
MYLGHVFKKVPAIESPLTTLLHRYCMDNTTFTEMDYRNRLGELLEHAPNVSAVRLNLPFQLISKHCRAATMILGNSFEALAQRPEESETLKTLVLENVTDTSVLKLWRNPQDVKNIIDVFSDLEHMLLSVRRHEDEQLPNAHFRQRLWEMITKARKLVSLCLISLDLDDKPFQTVRHMSQRDCSIDEFWSMSIPTIDKPPATVLPYLTFLELRRVEITGAGLLSLFKTFGSSLRELYLDQVYLKTVYFSVSFPSNHHEFFRSVLWERVLVLQVPEVLPSSLLKEQFLT